MLSKEQTTWNIIPTTYLESIGGFHRLNPNFDCQRIPQSISPFYKDVLRSWSEVALDNINNDPCLGFHQYLRNNKYIKIGNVSVFYKSFADLNINKVTDLCDENYEFRWVHVLK
jgi:hypothetical protein